MTILKVKSQDKFYKKSIGLLGKNEAEAIYFQTRFGIHTFFMQFPIDVLILDQNYKVVKAAENLLPNKIFLWSPLFDKVLELPAGELIKNKIKIGDKIILQFI
ncbi:DUF192 domain-containing protein [Candidatus Roizmanbacteria bacterium]|nr:DUF192 domain-containing protein [Candidatus Roizmanbacteria bacterium]